MPKNPEPIDPRLGREMVRPKGKTGSKAVDGYPEGNSGVRAFKAGQAAEMARGTKAYGKLRANANAVNTIHELSKGGSWKAAAKKAALRSFKGSVK